MQYYFDEFDWLSADQKFDRYVEIYTLIAKIASKSV